MWREPWDLSRSLVNQDLVLGEGEGSPLRLPPSRASKLAPSRLPPSRLHPSQLPPSRLPHSRPAAETSAWVNVRSSCRPKPIEHKQSFSLSTSPTSQPSPKYGTAATKPEPPTTPRNKLKPKARPNRICRNHADKPNRSNISHVSGASQARPLPRKVSLNPPSTK
jgi:hypothetical protein